MYCTTIHDMCMDVMQRRMNGRALNEMIHGSTGCTNSESGHIHLNDIYEGSTDVYTTYNLCRVPLNRSHVWILDGVDL